MIKKVKVKDLRVGVFVHDFNCSWSDGALYIEQNLINSEHVIDILRSWEIEEVYIDTSRGLDIDRKKIFHEQGKQSSEVVRNRHRARPEVPLVRELDSAKKVTQTAKDVMRQAHQQATEGKAPDVDPMYELARQMKSSLDRNRDALTLLTRIRRKDEYTLHHSISVSSLVLNMCLYCQVSDQQTLDLAVGALFHDIGKALVPQNILNKPGKLTDDEYREIQRHVEYSVDILSKTKGLPLECYDIALHHHERHDGTGYPHRQAENQISYGAQLTCISDVFDAITSERCYKPGMDTVLGLRKIYEGRGSFFSEEVTRDFVECVGVYPVGTSVILEDGRSGIVVGSTEDIMRPEVQILYDEKKKIRLKPYKVDLSQNDYVIATYGDPKKFGITSGLLLRKFLFTQLNQVNAN